MIINKFLFSKKMLWRTVLNNILFRPTQAASFSDGQTFLLTPTLLKESCSQCSACLKHCPHRALSQSFQSGKALLQIDYAKCSSCALCVLFCPKEILTMSPRELHFFSKETSTYFKVKTIE